MKLFGQHVKGPNTEVIVFPRQDFDIIITAQAILDDTPFTDLCPRPNPPKIMKPGGEWTEDRTDEEWIRQIERWGSQRSAWTILESLRATPKEILEWETVKYTDPSTWDNWKDELKAAFFTESEIVKIMMLVWSVNGMSQEKLDEARNRFLAGQARQPKLLSSPTVEPSSTPSGEPAKDSASVPQV